MPDSNVQGYTGGSRTSIFLNTGYVTSANFSQLAGELLHEMIHLANADTSDTKREDVFQLCKLGNISPRRQ